MRPIHIVAPHNDARQLEALCVRVDIHLSSCFAGCIRIRRAKNAVFQQVWVSVFGLAIDFISRDVNELLHSDFHCRFKHDVSATDVGLGEGEGIAKAEINVGLGGEVEDCVDAVLSQATEDCLFVGHVAVDELEVGA